jgi:hypothetical protein
MGYAVAAAVAIPVGLLDQYGRLRARPAFTDWGWFWWLLRVALECAISVGALYLATTLNVKYNDQWYGWIAAGLVGPSLAKSHLAEIARGERRIAYGLINFYERARGLLEEKIDHLAASQQTIWINSTILPNLRERDVSAAQLADRFEDYVLGLGGLTSVERDQEVAWIRTTKGEDLSEEQIRKALVRRAVNMRAWGLLKKLAQ